MVLEDSMINERIEIEASINTQRIVPCGCPEQILCQGQLQATSHDLNPNEKYFPMIARTNAKAFYGLPPASVQPLPRYNQRADAYHGRLHFANQPVRPNILNRPMFFPNPLGPAEKQEVLGNHNLGAANAERIAQLEVERLTKEIPRLRDQLQLLEQKKLATTGIDENPFQFEIARLR